jgi:hypothetical protein
MGETHNAESPKIFISHSSRDITLVESLIKLIRDSLNLTAREIRCTTVPGYRIRTGATVSETIMSEVEGCDILVSLITPHSSSSAYFWIEYGARLHTERLIYPLFAVYFGLSRHLTIRVAL